MRAFWVAGLGCVRRFLGLLLTINVLWYMEAMAKQVKLKHLKTVRAELVISWDIASSINAVEGLELSDEMRRTFAKFDEDAIPNSERVARIKKTYG